MLVISRSMRCMFWTSSSRECRISFSRALSTGNVGEIASTWGLYAEDGTNWPYVYHQHNSNTASNLHRSSWLEDNCTKRKVLINSSDTQWLTLSNCLEQKNPTKFRAIWVKTQTKLSYTTPYYPPLDALTLPKWMNVHSKYRRNDKTNNCVARIIKMHKVHIHEDQYS